jgi:hypothetical protein
MFSQHTEISQKTKPYTRCKPKRQKKQDKQATYSATVMTQHNPIEDKAQIFRAEWDEDVFFKPSTI